VVITRIILAAWGVVVCPTDQCGLLIVEKPIVVFDGELSLDELGVKHIHATVLTRCYVRPVIPSTS